MSFSEIIIIFIFFFPLPPLVTGLLAKRKGKKFWIWAGIGFLICASSNIITGILKSKLAPGVILPELQLVIGALSGPVVAFFLKTASKKTEMDS